MIPYAAILLVALLLSGGAVADESAPAPGTVSGSPSGVVFLRQQTESQLLARNLLDKQVLNPHADDLGRVDDVVLDQNGRVVGIVVSVGGFLGLGGKLVALPWHEVTIRYADKVVVVNLSKEQVSGAPEFRSWRETGRERGRTGRRRSLVRTAESPP